MIYIDYEENVFRFFVFKSRIYKTIVLFELKS